MSDKLKACCAATGINWSRLAREESEERIRYLERENHELRETCTLQSDFIGELEHKIKKMQKNVDEIKLRLCVAETMETFGD